MTTFIDGKPPNNILCVWYACGLNDDPPQLGENDTVYVWTNRISKFYGVVVKQT